MTLFIRTPQDFDKLKTVIYNQIAKATDAGLNTTSNWLEQNSPKGESPEGQSLAGGYRVVPTKRRGSNPPTPGKIVNRRKGSYFRLVGRGPGGFPPSSRGSPLARWARAKGIPPYLVGRGIARRGTQRWRRGAQGNILGINPTAGEIQADGPAQRIFEASFSRALNIRI